MLVRFQGVPCTSCRAERTTYPRAVAMLAGKAMILDAESWGTDAATAAAFLRADHLPGTVLVGAGDLATGA